MKKFFSLILLLLFTVPLAAQDESGKRAGGIQVRAFAFALFEEIDKLELRSEERVVGELELPVGQLRQRSSVSSRSFSYGVTANEVFRSLGKVTLPATGSDIILVFAPTKTGYRAFAVRSDDPDFRGNDKHVFNFTTHRLGILLGTAKQVVEPFGNARLRPAFAPEATFYKAMFSYEKDGKFVPFNNTRWPVNSNTKALVFVFEDPSTGRIAYRSVTALAN